MVEDRPTLLLVEDDEPLRTRLARAFDERGYLVTASPEGAAALAAAAVEPPEFAVVDLKMPGSLTGLDVVRHLKTMDPATRIVVLTGFGSIATAVEAIKLGATQYLTKPADADEIISALNPGATLSPSADVEVASLARAEWEHIQRVLQQCDGNVSQAARLLGIHRRSLQRKLNKYPPLR